jgi:hypothetical protein
MSVAVWRLVLLGAVPCVSLACSSRSGLGARASDNLERSCYASVQGQPVRSTLISVKEPGTERLMGMIELDTGERLLEEATLDASGRLVEAEATLSPMAAGHAPQDAIRVSFRPERDAIEVIAPARHLEWSVPHDLPWAWLPLLTAPLPSGQGRAPIATPLGARVAFRAADGGRVVRMLDLGALRAQTLTADQLVVTDGDGEGATVVLGDDAIDVENGTPRRLHLSALDASLEILDARVPSSALVAALRCTALSGSFAP